MAANAGDTTLGFEIEPEFGAPANPSNSAGGYADTSLRARLGYALDRDWTLGAYFKTTIKNDGTAQYYVEPSLGYRLNVGFPEFTLKPSVAFGDTWDATGLGPTKNANAPYYALYVAGDWDFDNSNWTWNVFNLRYRNAFNYTWNTPKVSTGVTYEFEGGVSLYGNVGYCWKDTGSGLHPDKVSVAVGVTRKF